MNGPKQPIDSILDTVLEELIEQFSDNIISIFGIGSYFDNSLPKDWIKNDLDIIVIVKSLENIPKPDWTDVRYEKKEINDHEVWLSFNNLEAYQEKQLFEAQSFSNYEWSLLDLKLPQNSQLLYGKDIRDQLPDITRIEFDYDNILARSLYHLDNSFKEAIVGKDMNASMQQFTKGVFKFGFYLCIYFEKDFRFTSIRAIANTIELLIEQNRVEKEILDYIKDAIFFRRTHRIPSRFNNLRNSFILRIFSLIGKGKLHRRMNFDELIQYLGIQFRGLRYMIQFAKRVKNRYYEIKSEN
ncbi:MAG: hypothetical protein ACFFHV_13585 [Promethearchaeota archaeon]